jgi:cytochrome c oxidase subunit 2
MLLLGMCSYAYAVLRSDEATKKNALTVNVTARQFIFQFSYPQASGKTVTSPVLYLPAGRPVVFKLRSMDVVHSFFVPEFSEKLDAVPGITTTLRVTPNRVGNYPVECTELCGPGHSLMRAAVHVVRPASFSSWLSSQKPGAPSPIGSAGTPPGEKGGGSK